MCGQRGCDLAADLLFSLCLQNFPGHAQSTYMCTERRRQIPLNYSVSSRLLHHFLRVRIEMLVHSSSSRSNKRPTMRKAEKHVNHHRYSPLQIFLGVACCRQLHVLREAAVTRWEACCLLMHEGSLPLYVGDPFVAHFVGCICLCM